MKLHDVFHVALLSPYRLSGTVQPPPAVLIEGEEEYEIDKILDHRDKPSRQKGKTHEYLVKWLGYGSEHNTWEAELSLQRSSSTRGCNLSSQTR